MPWKITDVDSHKKGLSATQKKKWVAIANAVLKQCQDSGGTGCDAKAIRTANSRVSTANNMNTYTNTNSEYEVREETLNGRQYLVVPVIMMVEGVHNGSHGPLLHTADELGKIPESWNGIPVTVGHPVVDGNPVSANSPAVLEEWATGIVFNTYMNDNRLRSEAWLDKEKLQKYENLKDRIEAGEIIEVSVGVFSDEEDVEGTWNNEDYIAIAHNFRPDHLAVLPNQTGACSVEDGCGIRVNSKNMEVNEKNRLEILQQLKQQDFVINELVVNESLLELVEKVRSKVYSMDSQDCYYYVEDITENSVIYRKEEKNTEGHESTMIKQGFSIAADNSVVFVGDPVKVKKKVEYETVVTNNVQHIKRSRKTNLKEEVIMSNEKCTPCIKKKVGALIANTATKFTEEDRVWLETLEEDQLDQMEPIAVTPKAEKSEITSEMAVNALKQGWKTTQDVLNVMPDEMKEQMQAALVLHENQKKALVDGIMANADGVWEKAELEGMKLEQLQKIAKTSGYQETSIQANYAGLNAGGRTTITDNGENDVPIMELAGESFATKK